MHDISFNQLSNELYLAIGSHLKASDLAAFTQTSRRMYVILQDILHDIAVTYTVGPSKECNVERTVLQWAVFKSEQRRCTLAALVRKGADIYVEGELRTLLHDVAARGDEEATKILVKAGIHPWITSDAPLVYASGGGHEAVVRYLLYDAVDMWQREAFQRTTTCEEWSQFTKPLKDTSRLWALQEGLHCAAKGGHVKVTELLCQHVNVSEPSRNGVPFTSSAAEGGSIEIMEILLGLGAKLDSIALSIAAGHGHLPLVEYIISKRPMDVKYYAGTTPLHRAAKKGHTDIVRVLLLHGADHETEDKREATALDLATHYCHDDVINILADLPITDHPHDQPPSLWDEDW